MMYNYKNKSRNVELLNKYMLSRTLTMFNYVGLPDTLPSVEIEKQLQVNGYTFITEVDGKLYAFYGSLAGEPNVYGEPTKIVINNVALNFNETLDIENDGVLIKNDDMKLGLIPLFERYNTLLIENEITMFINTYNTRVQTLISSGDDATKESAELYLKKVIDGELGIIGENRIFDGIRVQNSQTDSNITKQLIELNQYLKASLYNEVGINSNFNMKRERLISSEVDMNTDNLHPLIDNMLLNRQKGIEKLNEMYGLEAYVEFGSIWKIRNIKDVVSIEKEILGGEPIRVSEKPGEPGDEPIAGEPGDEPIAGEPGDEPATEESIDPADEPTNEVE